MNRGLDWRWIGIGALFMFGLSFGTFVRGGLPGGFLGGRAQGRKMLA